MSYWYYTNRFSQFKGLKSNEVVDLIILSIEKYLSSRDSIRALFREFSYLPTDSYFISRINKDYIDLVDVALETKGYCSWRYYFPTVAKVLMDRNIFSTEGKSRLFDLFLKHHNRFRSAARKVIVDMIIPGMCVSKDLRLIDFMRKYHRLIDPEYFDQLMTFIDGGKDNPNVKAILNKTKVFNYTKYDQKTVESDFNEKVKLLKEVCNTQTVLKRIPFEFEIEPKHIEQLAPITRFEFLRFAFRQELTYYCRTYYGSSTVKDIQYRVDSRKRKLKFDKLKVKPIDPEKVKELLFCISLQKNEELNMWFSKYQEYYNIATGKAKIKTYNRQ